MKSSLRLEVFHNGDLLKEVAFDGESLWLGRDEECSIRLDDRSISRKHALIHSTENGIEVQKKTKFGQVKINGKDVDQAMLIGGERLELGAFEILVKKNVEIKSEITKTVPAEPESDIGTIAASDFSDVASEIPEFDPGATPDEPAIASFQDLPKTGNAVTGSFDFAHVENDGATRVFKNTSLQMKPILEFGDGSANVSFYEIADPEIAIGRSQKCHVVLEDKRSSRKHSLIQQKNGKFYLKDLGSANGTLLNGERVDEQELQSGDAIKIGDTQFTFKMVQGDYEQKKAEFFQVPPEAMPSVSEAYIPTLPQSMGAAQMDLGTPYSDFSNSASPAQPVFEEPPVPDFAAPVEEKGSLIGKLLQRFRTMNTKQQMIWGAIILALVYMGFDDEPDKKAAKLNLGADQKKIVKKVDKKPGSGTTFEMLTPEQQTYIESTYVIAFEHYKNREYDKSLLELGKIFSIVQDYKNAREIDTYAREGKRKLEAQEEERKRKEQERQAQLRLQELLDKAGLLIEQKNYKEAEALFPEIEILQPENAAVSSWRKKLVEESEKEQKEEAERKRVAVLNQKAKEDVAEATALAKDKKYFDALDILDDVAERASIDKKILDSVKAQIKQIEGTVAAERDPMIAQGKQLEQEGKLAESYKVFQKASEIDPTDAEAPAGMKRILGSLNAMAKSVYADGVIAEGFGDYDVAEKKYREVMEVVTPDNSYYTKAKARLKIFSALRKSQDGPK